MTQQYFQIITHLRRLYPLPEVDPGWVQQCAQLLAEDGQEVTEDTIHDQFIYSDLSLSTRGSALPVSLPSTSHGSPLFTLTPILVQVLAISEIGASAFTLRTQQENRRDILSGKTRIRGMDDVGRATRSEGGEGGGGEDREGEGEGGENEEGIPAYSRSMLHFEVTDGRTVMRAIEYKRLNGITLGETPLGIKLLLQGVKALREVLLLTPANCTVIGGSVDAFEAEQPRMFTESLAARLDPARQQRAPPARRGRAITSPAMPSRARARPTTTASSASTPALTTAASATPTAASATQPVSSFVPPPPQLPKSSLPPTQSSARLGTPVALVPIRNTGTPSTTAGSGSGSGIPAREARLAAIRAALAPPPPTGSTPSTATILVASRSSTRAAIPAIENHNWQCQEDGDTDYGFDDDFDFGDIEIHNIDDDDEKENRTGNKVVHDVIEGVDSDEDGVKENSDSFAIDDDLLRHLEEAEALAGNYRSGNGATAIQGRSHVGGFSSRSRHEVSPGTKATTLISRSKPSSTRDGAGVKSMTQRKKRAIQSSPEIDNELGDADNPIEVSP